MPTSPSTPFEPWPARQPPQPVLVGAPVAPVACRPASSAGSSPRHGAPRRSRRPAPWRAPSASAGDVAVGEVDHVDEAGGSRPPRPSRARRHSSAPAAFRRRRACRPRAAPAWSACGRRPAWQLAAASKSPQAIASSRLSKALGDAVLGGEGRARGRARRSTQATMPALGDRGELAGRGARPCCRCRGAARSLGIAQRKPCFAGLVQLRALLDELLPRLVDRHVGRVGDGRPGLGRVVRPVHGVAQHLLDAGMVVGRIGLVAGAEIEDAAGAALVGQAGAEHLAALEPGDEHRLQRLGHGERLAVHLLVLELENGRRARAAIGWLRLIDPEPLALARLAPFQGAGRAHQPLEDLREMAGMQDDQAHAFPDPLLHALDDRVVDLAVGRVAPPEQHVGLGEPLLGQPVLRLLQRRGGRRRLP